jgi:hypothetical protein
MSSTCTIVHIYTQLMLRQSHLVLDLAFNIIPITPDENLLIFSSNESRLTPLPVLRANLAPDETKLHYNVGTVFFQIKKLTEYCKLFHY